MSKTANPESSVEVSSEDVAALQAKLAEAEKALQEERERAAAAEQELQESQAQAQAQATASAGKAKAFKPKNVKVISATQYSYMLEDNATRITPNAPVGATRAPGNLLDCLMEKGLVVEYEV